MDSFYLATFYLFRFITLYTPKFIMDLILKAGALFFYTINKKHRRIAQVNLDLAYEDRITQAEKKAIIIGCYKTLVYTLADFFKNQGASKEEVLEKVTFHDEAFLTKPLKEGKKVIIMTGHYGNWELLSLSIAAKFTPLAIVGRDLESDAMNQILTKNREQFDIELLSKTGAMKGMVKALKSNRPVGILVDQNTSETEGLLVDFFGKKARHTPSIAVLAKKFDAVIVPAYITMRDSKHFDVRFYEEIVMQDTGDKEQDIFNCVQAQANVTQKIIEAKPEEWFWLHQRWKNQYEEAYNAK